MSKEKDVLAMYDNSMPGELPPEQPNPYSHIAWTLLALALAMVVWLVVALANAENQRYALAQSLCRDQIFPQELDSKCLYLVRSRDHWWQHVGYALTHLNLSP